MKTAGGFFWNFFLLVIAADMSYHNFRGVQVLSPLCFQLRLFLFWLVLVLSVVRVDAQDPSGMNTSMI
jgi:hypothetical protein